MEHQGSVPESGQRGVTQDHLHHASRVQIPSLSRFRGVTVITLDFESNNPGSNPGETYGVVAQLVERSLSMREVRGSTPRNSTIY